MALRKEWLLSLTRAIVKHGATVPACVLGDQTTYLTHADVVRILKSKSLLRNEAEFVPDHKNNKYVSLQTVLSMIGVVGYHDIDLNGQAAMRLDFLQTLPPSLFGAAATMLDIGTLEHIFDIASAFGNIVRRLKKDGLAILLSPISWFEHGFVNFNSLLFKEFFSYNNFEILEHGVIVTPFTDNVAELLAVLKVSRRITDAFVSELSRLSSR
jgi:hypothetical protein